MAETVEETDLKITHEGIIFVKSTTSTKGLATCIFGSAINEQKKEIRLRGIGAGSICQMTKAFIITKGRLSEKGVNATVDMYFKDIQSRREGEDSITAVEYLVKFN